MTRVRAAALHVLPELPVVLFFAFALSLAVEFHGREIAMLDYTPTFDHWWYFSHRLREGALAQWNPFSLLGRVAVQWHYVPVSVLSPLLVARELTPERFHAFHVAGTLLVLLAVYTAGRLAGYGRHLPVLGVLLVAASGFRYWLAFLHFVTLLAVFPVVMAWLVTRADRPVPPRPREIAGFGLALAVALLGLRLELMVYVAVLVTLAGLARAAADRDGWRPRLAWAFGAVAATATALAANAWQLALLAASTLDSQRGAIAPSPARLLDRDLLSWLLGSLALQPLFLVLGGALALAAALRPRLANARLPATGVMALVALETATVWALARAGRALAAPLVPHLAEAGFRGPHELALSAGGAAGIVLGSLVFLRAEPRPALRRALGFAAVLAAGFAVATYSGHTWIVNTSVHPYFVPLPLSGLLAVGAVGLWLRGRGWIVATLVGYHLLSESGALVLFETLGLPWFPPRAAIVELPLQLIVALEAARRIGALLVAALGRLGAARLLTAPRAATLAGVVGLVIAGVVFQQTLLPTTLAADLRGFPFGGPAREVELPNNSLEHWTPDGTGRSVPVGCQYHGAPGASLERVTAAADGRTAALLLPSGRADSWLRCMVSEVAPLRGRYVRLSASVRSAGRYPGGIQLDVQDGFSPIAFERRDAGGVPAAAPGWARRAVVTRVHPEARTLLFTVNATYAADAPVLVDDLRLEVTEAEPPRRRVYRADFPFAESVPGAPGGSETPWVRDALAAAEALGRAATTRPDPFHRQPVADAVLLLSPAEQHYRFLPAYSRTLNTAPVYASEIPARLMQLFRDLPEGVEATPGHRPAHPDMPPLLRAFKQAQRAEARAGEPWPYPAEIAILPHRDDRPVGRALLAEEGGTARRAFLATRVLRFGDAAAEHAHLADRLRHGGALADAVTTSDPAFPASAPAPGAAEARGAVAFLRDEPERVSLEVRIDVDAHLALLDLWSPGWRATVDGRPVAVYRGYIAARFVPVPAGRHVVEFTYRVPGLGVAAWVSALAWAVGFLALWQARRA
jgi:hypothetical protein